MPRLEVSGQGCCGCVAVAVRLWANSLTASPLMQGEFHSAQEVGRVLFTMSGRKCSADRFKATNLKGCVPFQALVVACSWSLLARCTVAVLVLVILAVSRMPMPLARHAKMAACLPWSMDLP